jgi:hydroxyacylglutathione hydrolase
MSGVSSDILVPIELGMTRVFLLRGERPVLVDAGNAGDEGKIIHALSHLGVAPADLALIILTHGHLDHYGSAAALQAASGATLAVGVGDCSLVAMTDEPHYHPATLLGRLLVTLGFTRHPNQTPASPDWCIDGEFSLAYLGIPGRVLPTPGHTAGSLSIALDTGEVIVGDMLMSFVRRRRPGKPIFLEDPDAWRESLRRIMALKPRTIHAGHGGPFEPEQVLRVFPWARPAHVTSD